MSHVLPSDPESMSQLALALDHFADPYVRKYFLWLLQHTQFLQNQVVSLLELNAQKNEELVYIYNEIMQIEADMAAEDNDFCTDLGLLLKGIEKDFIHFGIAKDEYDLADKSHNLCDQLGIPH